VARTPAWAVRPGYVGFEQGGLLVDAIRQHPYSMLLLDEIERRTRIFSISCCR
jgi:ATP-dependent Clp protease ATP-binding subunit ClpA